MMRKIEAHISFIRFGYVKEEEYNKKKGKLNSNHCWRMQTGTGPTIREKESWRGPPTWKSGEKLEAVRLERVSHGLM